MSRGPSPADMLYQALSETHEEARERRVLGIHTTPIAQADLEAKLRYMRLLAHRIVISNRYITQHASLGWEEVPDKHLQALMREYDREEEALLDRQPPPFPTPPPPAPAHTRTPNPHDDTLIAA